MYTAICYVSMKGTIIRSSLNRILAGLSVNLDKQCEHNIHVYVVLRSFCTRYKYFGHTTTTKNFDEQDIGTYVENSHQTELSSIQDVALKKRILIMFRTPRNIRNFGQIVAAAAFGAVSNIISATTVSS